MGQTGGRFAALITVVLVSGCGANMPSPTQTDSQRSLPAATLSTPGEASTLPGEALTGEVFLDLAWPSRFRDGCLSLHDGTGHIEIVSTSEWHLQRDPQTLWFEVVDGDGAIILAEHRVATVRGRFLDEPGCREGRLFEVMHVDEPPETSAWLNVEVAYGEGAGFEEGAVNVVRVLRDGIPIIQEPVPTGGRLAVPAGPITVVDYQKPCSANCSSAYGEALPCEVELELARAEEMTLTAVLTPDAEHGCVPVVRPGGPADLVGVLQASPDDSAELPYPGVVRCIRVRHNAVPVLPEGWSMSYEPFYSVTIFDPTGQAVASETDILWLNGEFTGDERPFRCDMGEKFAVAEVVMTRSIEELTAP